MFRESISFRPHELVFVFFVIPEICIYFRVISQLTTFARIISYFFGDFNFFSVNVTLFFEFLCVKLFSEEV